MCSTSYRPQLILLMMAMFVMFSTAANAELKHVSPMGFVSTHELFLNATPAQSYSALVDHVGEWWDASHSFAGQAQAFMIDDVAGGCFCEVSGDIRVQHMQVVNVQKGRLLVMRGGLGPLQSMAVTGSMRFAFEDHEKGTRLTYTYAVGGYAPQGLEALAEPVDQVQLGQLKRLQAYIDKHLGD